MWKLWIRAIIEYEMQNMLIKLITKERETRKKQKARQSDTKQRKTERIREQEEERKRKKETGSLRKEPRAKRAQ